MNHFKKILLILVMLPLPNCPEGVSLPEFNFRKCEPIRIEMCRGIGYNETSMPNLVGHEIQTEVEYTLQTFAPLIEYVCSSQLKLFLCTAYVPMCTPKAPIHAIGPCRSLCESVRMRCHPVLQGFGFPWPPALDCERFPKENNHESMCMEGPGEAHSPIQENDFYGAGGKLTENQGYPLDCSNLVHSRSYVKLRSGRCAPLCDADLLFYQNEKYIAEVWVSTWTYATCVVALISTLCLVLCDDCKVQSKWSGILTPLVWCHDMVTIGWAVRFFAGRTSTACGFDPQLPNVSLLSVDGLSNTPCAAVFLLRYYFGMAACAWWAILCLGWHREVRRNSPDAKGHMSLNLQLGHNNSKHHYSKQFIKEFGLAHNNFVCFIAWALPAFQTATVIVARLVDADELLGACYVGNQSDKGLQVLVATPIFCYWIFGSMNLISGYLVHRRNNEFLNTTNSVAMQQQLYRHAKRTGAIATFLLIYCVSCALLLFAVIYEFANIDIWLNMDDDNYKSTPMWPFLTRAFMELMLGVICFAWVLGPYITNMYKRQLLSRPHKQPTTAIEPATIVDHRLRTGRSTMNTTFNSMAVSYHTVRLNDVPHSKGSISLNQMSNYWQERNSDPAVSSLHSHHVQNFRINKYSMHKQHHAHHHSPQLLQKLQFQRYGNETLL